MAARGVVRVVRFDVRLLALVAVQVGARRHLAGVDGTVVVAHSVLVVGDLDGEVGRGGGRGSFYGWNMGTFTMVTLVLIK